MYRPKAIIFALTDNDQVVRQLNISRGVVGYKITDPLGPSLVEQVINFGIERGYYKKGAKIITLLKDRKEDSKSFPIEISSA